MRFTFPIVLEKLRMRIFIASVAIFLFEIVAVKSIVARCLPKVQ